MGLFNLFRSKSKKQKIGHIQALIALSGIDGNSDLNEFTVIRAICRREGISDNELEKILLYPKVNFVIPNDGVTKLKYLTDMMALIIADGVADEREIDLFVIIAKKFGYTEDFIMKFVEALCRTISKNNSENNIKG